MATVPNKGSLSTKTDISIPNPLRVVRLTQDRYDALKRKRSDTLYIIVEG